MAQTPSASLMPEHKLLLPAGIEPDLAPNAVGGLLGRYSGFNKGGGRGLAVEKMVDHGAIEQRNKTDAGTAQPQA